MGQFSFYLLVPRHTPAYSLLANAALCCRFGPPLAFNFMAALAMPPSPHHSWRVRPARDLTPCCASDLSTTGLRQRSMPQHAAAGLVSLDSWQD